MMNNTVHKNPTPAGFMTNARGHLVPVSKVAEIDKLRDQTVRNLVDMANELSRALGAFKVQAFSDISAFCQTSAEQYDAKVGGDKGNVTLQSFDGRFKVIRSLQESISFDERLQAAKALIDECITGWAKDSSDEIKVLVNDAFQVDKQGSVSTNRILGLRRLKIEHPTWRRAMDAISDSLQVVGSRSYVRIYQRVGDTDRWEPIALDLATV
jgi:hypothetical protein